MAQDRTAGFDLIVQLPEREINEQLRSLYAAGNSFPHAFRLPLDYKGVEGIVDINLVVPTADLDRPRSHIGLILPFKGSQIEIMKPTALTIGPLAGTITVVAKAEMSKQKDFQTPMLDFEHSVPQVTVAFAAASEALLVPALKAIGVSIAQARDVFAGLVLEQLQTGVRHISLSEKPIRVRDDDDPATPYDIDVTTVNDKSKLDKDCLAFGVRMSSSSGGNINGITKSYISNSGSSLLMLSNYWLLAHVLRPKLASALGVAVSDFDTPLRLNRNISAPGGEGTLTSLEARVIGNQVRVDGRAKASDTGWSAKCKFSFFVELALNSKGELLISATTPNVDTDVSLAWWVWVTTLGVGAIFLGVLGPLIGFILSAVADSIGDGIGKELAGTAVGGAISKQRPIPLGPLGESLSLADIELDDLEFRGTVVRKPATPVHSHGSKTSLTGFFVDLDAGKVLAGEFSGADLAWDPSCGILAVDSAGLSVIGRSYGALSAERIMRLPLSKSSVPLTAIPSSVSPKFPFVSHDEVVFGVRTTEGRYAKVRAWRSIMDAGALLLEWETYDTPVPRLSIQSTWSILDEGKASSIPGPAMTACTSTPVRRRGTFEAWPALLTFPVDYQWCLCGKILDKSEGRVLSSEGMISYQVDGRRLSIETEIGKAVNCELCVSAIDARGQELFTCIPVKKPGNENRCIELRVFPVIPKVIEVVPHDVPRMKPRQPIPEGILDALVGSHDPGVIGGNLGS